MTCLYGSDIGLPYTQWLWKWFLACRTFSALLDILHPGLTFFPVDDWRISVVVLVFLVGHFMGIEPCWTNCPARSELSSEHQQKSAGHVRHVQHISWSLYTVGKLSIFTFQTISSKTLNDLGMEEIEKKNWKPFLRKKKDFRSPPPADH